MQSELSKAARDFMFLFIVDAGDRGISLDDIDPMEFSQKFAALEAALSAQVQDVAGLSAWQGWDQSRMPWSEAKHKDAVCYAAFGEAWSMNDAAALIGFIERTWTAAPAAKQEGKL